MAIQSTSFPVRASFKCGTLRIQIGNMPERALKIEARVCADHFTWFFFDYNKYLNWQFKKVGKTRRVDFEGDPDKMEKCLESLGVWLV